MEDYCTSFSLFVILAIGSTMRTRYKFSFAGQQTLTKSTTINFARAFPRVIPLLRLSPGKTPRELFTRIKNN